MSRFLTALTATNFDEMKNLWRLREPLVYESDLLGKTITVPVGFETDYASVPRIPGVYEFAGGKCNRAATLHDYAYTAQFVERETADRLLREAILATGYEPFIADVFYEAVRVGGASHWKAPTLSPILVQRIAPGGP